MFEGVKKKLILVFLICIYGKEYGSSIKVKIISKSYFFQLEYDRFIFLDIYLYEKPKNN